MNEVVIREYKNSDIEGMIPIWNQVVEDGVAFPQIKKLDEASASDFFAAQTYTAIAELDGRVVGLYILHPNNIGRCGHIANSSYAVAAGLRGRHIGERLVRHSLGIAADNGFRLLQFNAVVSSNTGAIHLYEKLGFKRIGTVPGGFLMKNGEYEDIVLFYYSLV